MTRRGDTFAYATSRLVYSQLWEDPEIDREALRVEPHHRLVGIASAGCNLLTYLLDDPAEVAGVDLNPHQLALCRLKAAALRHLPAHADFFAMFGTGKGRENPRRYDRHIRDALDADTRVYWEQRRPPCGRRRIDVFSRGLHGHSLVGRSIAAAHCWARLRRRDMRALLGATDLAEQRATFETQVAPLFDHWLIRSLARLPVTLYPLGIPASQRADMLATAGGDLIGWLRSRIERLACDYPVADNYFAWQIFGQGYDVEHRHAIPPFLEERSYPILRGRVGRLSFHGGTLTDYLARRSPGSVHRFVLLDSQDWMTPEDVGDLWHAIDRAASPADARVIFRTAGDHGAIARKLPAWIGTRWRYVKDESDALHARDRSSIYGGFHIYERLARAIDESGPARATISRCGDGPGAG